MFINIEIKAPRIDEIKERYSSANAIEKVYDLIMKYNMFSKFLISSFSHDILKEAE
jgi:hypothetical protein